MNVRARPTVTKGAAGGSVKFRPLAEPVGSLRRTLKARVGDRIQRSKADVFVPDDFQELADYDQVKRVLRKLVDEGVIIRLGYGVNARLRASGSTGKRMLAARGGFDGAVRQTLKKLQVRWTETDLVREYNAGRTTQIQMSPVFAIRGRFVHKLRYNALEARFEKARG